jgi:LacI family transcriptional regulator
MILVAPSMDIFHEAVEEDIKPTVLCATSGTGDANGWQEMPAVTINNRKAMNDLVSFLASSGFRKLTHIAGLPDNFDAAERKRAFLNATSEIPGLQGAVLEAACNSDQGYGLMQDYLSTHSSLPDVFLAFNESVAFGALRALTDAGIRVPGDVGITGWDDISVAHDMALTTVHMPVDDLGRTAARMLLQKLDNEAAAPLQKVLTLEMPVCIRRSTMQPDALA